MKKIKWCINIVTIFLVFPVFSSEAPTLHDIEIEGTINSPKLQIESLSLEVNKDYLFVFNNTLPITLNIFFDKFGQHVFTRYLQGSSNVSQESINVLPSGKVLWHFTVSKAGEFSLYVVNPSTLSKSDKYKIIVYDPLAADPSNKNVYQASINTLNKPLENNKTKAKEKEKRNIPYSHKYRKRMKD